MKTQNHSINDVLAINATSFFIPPFQRAYAWGKAEIERYFSDISKIMDSELDDKQNDKLEHFFGTIVIKEEKEGFANKSVVVDGQQRLTTTLIFLIALRDIEENQENQNFITNTYLINNTSTFQDKIKLKQVTKDWDAYKALVNRTSSKEPLRVVHGAYKLFLKLISDKNKSNPLIKLEDYIKAIGRMNVAVIFLDERPFKGEDPQVIFETLNSLGKPLTLSDLVRNFVLLKMNSLDQSNSYERIWYPKIEATFNEKTSEFFRDYLQYKTKTSIKVVSDNNTKDIYHLFKSFVDQQFKTSQDFIDDIIRYVDWYRWIINEIINDPISQNIDKNKEIIELLRNIFHDIGTEAFKPFVLGLLECNQDNIGESKLSDDKLISILKFIRTYLIRRRICGLTQGENKNIVLLSHRISDLAEDKICILDLLSDMFYKMRLPNDIEMKNQLSKMNFYQDLKKYSKFILGKIEENETKVAVNFRDSNVTIEHVMPQSLDDDHWKQDLGADFEKIHKQYLHNLGNLILTEFNSEMGNKSFAEKKLRLNKSSLSYRLFVINKEFWNELSIQEHQESMISRFLTTFILPEPYCSRDNWNSKVIERSRFSPLDLDASDIAEGNKPVEILFERNNVKVKSWRDVLLQFLKYIQANQSQDFKFIIDNQKELFGRDDVIISYSSLKSIIENQPESRYKKDYKTLNGQSYCKDLSKNELFVHVHISANVCINRIEKIMNKFNLSVDSFEIVLSE